MDEGFILADVVKDLFNNNDTQHLQAKNVHEISSSLQTSSSTSSVNNPLPGNVTIKVEKDEEITDAHQQIATTFIDTGNVQKESTNAVINSITIPINSGTTRSTSTQQQNATGNSVVDNAKVSANTQQKVATNVHVVHNTKTIPTNSGMKLPTGCYLVQHIPLVNKINNKSAPICLYLKPVNGSVGVATDTTRVNISSCAVPISNSNASIKPTITSKNSASSQPGISSVSKPNNNSTMVQSSSSGAVPSVGAHIRKVHNSKLSTKPTTSTLLTSNNSASNQPSISSVFSLSKNAITAPSTSSSSGDKTPTTQPVITSVFSISKPATCTSQVVNTKTVPVVKQGLGQESSTFFTVKNGKLVAIATVPVAPCRNRPGEYVTCPVCEKKITQPQLFAHLKVHEMKKNVKCKYCNENIPVIENDYTTWRHVRRLCLYTKCKYCDKGYWSQKELQKHCSDHKVSIDILQEMEKDAIQNGNYTCKVCQKTLNNIGCFRNHIRRKHRDIDSTSGDAKLTCLFCEYVSTSSRNVAKHQWRVHNNVYPNSNEFKCSICGYRFVTSIGLKRHKNKLHPNDSTVKLHRNHPKVRHSETNQDKTVTTAEIECSICGQHCVDNSELTRHKLRLHSAQIELRELESEIDSIVTDFKCSVCGRYLTNGTGLANHMTIHSKGIHNSKSSDDNHSTNEVQPDLRDPPINENTSASSCYDNTCAVCSEECYSIPGLICHLHKHKTGHKLSLDVNADANSKGDFKCKICEEYYAQKARENETSAVENSTAEQHDTKECGRMSQDGVNSDQSQTLSTMSKPNDNEECEITSQNTIGTNNSDLSQTLSTTSVQNDREGCEITSQNVASTNNSDQDLSNTTVDHAQQKERDKSEQDLVCQKDINSNKNENKTQECYDNVSNNINNMHNENDQKHINNESDVEAGMKVDFAPDDSMEIDKETDQKQKDSESNVQVAMKVDFVPDDSMEVDKESGQKQKDGESNVQVARKVDSVPDDSMEIDKETDQKQKDSESNVQVAMKVDSVPDDSMEIVEDTKQKQKENEPDVEATMKVDYVPDDNMQTDKVSNINFVEHQCPICGENLSSQAVSRKHMHQHYMVDKLSIDMFAQLTASEKEDTAQESTKRVDKQQSDGSQHVDSTLDSKQGNIKTCFPCHKVFCDVKRFQRHQAAQHNIKPFVCNECGAAFKWEISLKGHLKAHKGDLPYKCSICSKGFFTKPLMKRHIRSIHNKIPFTCDICGETFKGENILKTHTLIKHNQSDQPLLKCSYCDKRFVLKLQLERHLQTHSQERPFKCTICGKRFRIKPGLQSHQISHRTQRDFKCDICGDSFKSKGSLRTHKVIHAVASERPFQCGQCNKGFNVEWSLNSHMLRRHSDLPHECKYCKKKFAYQKSLRKHTLIHVAITEKHVQCPLCPKKFTTTRQMRFHLAGVHFNTKRHRCTLCKSRFKSPSTLMLHLKRHKCQVCGKKYKRLDYVVSHVRAIHSGERPFKCAASCGKVFVHRSVLLRHQEVCKEKQRLDEQCQKAQQLEQQQPQQQSKQQPQQHQQQPKQQPEQQQPEQPDQQQPQQQQLDQQQSEKQLPRQQPEQHESEQQQPEQQAELQQPDQQQPKQQLGQQQPVQQQQQQQQPKQHEQQPEQQQTDQ